MARRESFLCVLPAYEREPSWVHERTRAVYDYRGRAVENRQPMRTDLPLPEAVAGYFGVGAEIGKPKRPPGEFLPRVYRPRGPRLQPPIRAARDNAVHAARSVFRRLQDVFLYIEPRTRRNLQAHGHETRNLLILACTAVESGWRGVLRANGYRRLDRKTGKVVAERYWNAQADYVHCLELLRLTEWSVRIAGREGLGPLRPFEGWTPSAQLPWYRAYNGAKHDLENALSEATLGACVNACAAVAIMIWAQFGTWAHRHADSPLEILQNVNARESNATDPFLLALEPPWHASDYYAPPTLVGRAEKEWRAGKHWR